MKRLFTSVSITLFALILLALSPARSQESSKPQDTSRCSLNAAQAPMIRGTVKLGMTAQELLPVFPGNNEANKNALDHSEGFPNFGVARLGFFPGKDDRFAGIQSLLVVVFDGRVAEISVNYEQYPVGPQWRKVDDFVAKLSEAFRLPAAGDWRTADYDSKIKILTCSGWSLQPGSEAWERDSSPCLIRRTEVSCKNGPQHMKRRSGKSLSPRVEESIGRRNLGSGSQEGQSCPHALGTIISSLENVRSECGRVFTSQVWREGDERTAAV